MDDIPSDVRYAIRRWRAAPGFTICAALTLALGIGATTAIYSVVDAVMLRPLPYPDPERLVDLAAGTPTAIANRAITLEQIEYWRSHADLFTSVEAYVLRSMTLTGGGEPRAIPGAAVTGGLMPMLGLGAEIGRGLDARDAQPGAERVTALSDALWRARFGAAPDVLGRRIRLDNETFTIVGVMPPSFTFPRRQDFWIPLVLPAPGTARPPRVSAVARVRNDLRVAEAQARIDAMVPALRAAALIAAGASVQLTPPIARHVNAPVRRALVVLFGAVSLVLLIACANIANLLLVQGAGRSRELAVRTALGASRPRLVRQLLTEAALLALAGGTVGLLVARWNIDLLSAVTPRAMTFLTAHTFALDGRVLLFAIVVTAATALAFGVLPAVRAAGDVPHHALKAGTHTTATPRAARLRGVFVLAQLALSLMLLVAAGLMMRTFAHITRLDPGFDARNVLAVDLSLPRWKYGTRALQQQFFDDLAARLRRLPGVRATTITGGVPPNGGGVSFDLTFEIEGRGVVLRDPAVLMPFAEVDANYFSLMGIPLKAGRTFASDDRPDAPRAVIIGEAMARRLWNGGDPIGQRVRWDPDAPWYTVVGVVGDVYQFQHEATRGQFAVYYANSQSRGTPAQQTIVIRTAGDPASMIAPIKQEIWSADRDQPIARIETIESAYAEFFAAPRFNAVLMSLFAAVGLAITAVGLYGVLAYGIAQRTREFGIRLALGARRGDLLGLVLRSGLAIAALGLLIGVAGSLAVARTLDALLVDIPSFDAPTYAAVIALFAIVAVAAMLIPARRATRIDPVIALRHE